METNTTDREHLIGPHRPLKSRISQMKRKQWTTKSNLVCYILRSSMEE